MTSSRTGGAPSRRPSVAGSPSLTAASLVLGATLAVAATDDFIEPAAVTRQVTVTGTVFADANGNGRREADENGVVGVWVTDGGIITRSDAKGGYSLVFVAEEYRCVYITLPNGYKTTTPWYRLVRQDDKETRYTFDFGLQVDPAASERNFAFLVTADSQFSTEQEGLMLKADMQQITRSTGKPRFHVICGDLTMTGWLREWKWYADAMSTLTLPSYNVFGGHGGNYGRDTPLKRGSVHHFNLFCGPSYYSWNYGGRHFVAYNSVGYMSQAASARQQQWLKADLGMLAPGTEVVLVAHYPERLDKWRQDLKHVASFYGHWHENHLFHYQGTPYLRTNPLRGRDWGSFTRSVRFCRFQDGRLITEIRPTGQYQRLETVFPQAGIEVPKGVLPIRVIAFDTAARVTQVKAQVLAKDKQIAELSLTQLGQFTWGTRWDTSQLAAGDYVLCVRAEDDRRDTWPVRRCAFTIADRPPVEGRPRADWPMVFKSFSELRTSSDGLEPPLELAWSVPTGGSNQWGTSPIVYRGHVCVGQENMNVGIAEHTIQCYQASTGQPVWQTPVDGSVRLSPAAADGRIYAQTSSGSVYCLDAVGGHVLWKRRLCPARFYPDDYKCAVLVDRGKLIAFGEYGPLAVFDARTGEQLSRWPCPGPTSRTLYGGPFPCKDRVYLPTLWGVFACDLMTGKALWQTETQSLVRRGVSMGIVHDDVYYLRGYAGLAALDTATGKLLWTLPHPVNGGAPISTIANGVLYAGGSEAIAVEAKTGKKLWGYSVLREADESNQRQTYGGFSSPLVAVRLGLPWPGRMVTW